MVTTPLVQITGLRLQAGAQVLVDSLDLTLHAGEWLGLVGESGSGKSLTALAILALLPAGVRATAGRILWAGSDVLALDPAALRALRGGGIGVLFQDPLASLDPLRRIGAQYAEAFAAHGGPRGAAAWDQAAELLARLGLPDPGAALQAFPHQLSGGMRQRAALALALAGQPRLLIADEPTTALDPLHAAGLRALVAAERRSRGCAVLWISHDLASVREHADTVAVLYAGQVMEVGPARAVLAAPRHPYTQALLACTAPPVAGRWQEIGGQVPAASAVPAGCRFHPRCPQAQARCAAETPPAVALAAQHRAACWPLLGPGTPVPGFSGS